MSTFSAAVLQTGSMGSIKDDPVDIRHKMNEKLADYVDQAAVAGVNVLGFQELCNQPYFCPLLDNKWFAAAEPADGPTISLMRDRARAHGMALVVPIFEIEDDRYYNTAVIIDADGTVLGKYRKTHIPQSNLPSRGFEKGYFRPGNLGFPVFQTAYAKVGVVICHDRRFPESWRAVAVNGAELVFNPTAAHAGLYKKTGDGTQTFTPWEIIGRAAAIQNGYYVAAVNRTGPDPVRADTFFAGDSYITDPRGEIIASTGSEAGLVTAQLDLDEVRRVRVEWAYYRDRRPDIYGDLTDPLK